MISLYPCWRCAGEAYNIRCSIEYIRLNHFKYRLTLNTYIIIFYYTETQLLLYRIIYH